MREERFDVNPLVPENHANDEAILVAADIENRQIAYHVRRRKRLANVVQASPLGLNHRIEPNLQRGLGIGEFPRPLEEVAFADNVQNSILAKC
jgi:hypothetical protein